MPQLKQAIVLIENAQFMPPTNGDQWYKLMADIKALLRDHEEVVAELREVLEGEKEKFRIATINISEYIKWVGKAEAELELERKALEISVRECKSQYINKESWADQAWIDYFRGKAKE